MAEEPPILSPHHLMRFIFNNPNKQTSFTVGMYCNPVAGGTTIDSATKANTLCDAVKAQFVGPMVACIPENHFLNAVQLTMIGYPESWYGLSTDAASEGVREGECEPEYVAVVIRRTTGLAGRAGKGRIFMPYVPDEHLGQDSRLTDTAIGRYKAIGVQMKTNFNVSGAAWQWLQPNRQNGQMVVVRDCMVDVDVLTRRDRTAPRQILFLRA